MSEGRGKGRRGERERGEEGKEGEERRRREGNMRERLEEALRI